MRNVLRRQGELRGISISPFAPLTPTPLKTSRDTLHPETGATSLTIALRGTSGERSHEKQNYLCTLRNNPLFVVRRASALPKLCKMNTTISSTTTQTLTIS